MEVFRIFYFHFNLIMCFVFKYYINITCTWNKRRMRLLYWEYIKLLGFCIIRMESPAHCYKHQHFVAGTSMLLPAPALCCQWQHIVVNTSTLLSAPVLCCMHWQHVVVSTSSLMQVPAHCCKHHHFDASASTFWQLSCV